MADGLRLLGSCPKCSGQLDFGPEAVPQARFIPAPLGPATAAEPHLVLGIPRR